MFGVERNFVRYHDRPCPKGSRPLGTRTIIETTSVFHSKSTEFHSSIMLTENELCSALNLSSGAKTTRLWLGQLHSVTPSHPVDCRSKNFFSLILTMPLTCDISLSRMRKVEGKNLSDTCMGENIAFLS